MFFSLAQTLVCVLLIQGGLYALHLSGNGNGNGNANAADKQLQLQQSSSSSGGSNVGSALSSSSSNSMAAQSNAAIAQASAWQPHQQQQQQHQHAGGGAPPGGGLSHSSHRSAAAAAFDATTGRLNKEIADMAQLERERLMLLGLAKQTAESPAAPAGHHGRPIIAGRIQMQPSEELDVGDYPALVQQAARGFMFGSVQKQPPPPLANDEDYDQLRQFGRRPVKYDYGRIVQPAERELEAAETLYEPLHGFGDFDDFSELESNSQDAAPHVSEDELLRELDAYQYHGLVEDQPENPYRTLEALEQGAPDSFQQLFEQEQRDAPAKANANAKSHSQGNYNIRAQQKWAHKRAQTQKQQQQQPLLQRNIFGQHFKQQRGKLALANSEATASKHQKMAKEEQTKTEDKTHESSISAQPQHQTQSEDNKNKEAEQPMHPNHKRSGSGSGSAAAGSMGGYAPQPPPVSHSLASQLMLRTARGQRQYDVPQIECPTAMDGMERFACPTPDLQGRYRCIDDHVLCDGFIDCPEGEDEDRRSCMFYKTTKAHLDVLADALLRWARGR